MGPGARLTDSIHRAGSNSPEKLPALFIIFQLTNQMNLSDFPILEPSNQTHVALKVDFLTDLCHGLAKKAGWHSDLATGKPLAVNVPEKLLLIHSEISEACEGFRKALPDDKLPHRSMIEVELADAAIRIFDLAGAMGLDLGGALAEKLAYNMTRADHKPENRLSQNGKKF